MRDKVANAPQDEKLAWTEDRVALLSRLWGEGLSASQIATQLSHGVTRNAVIGKVHRLNLAGRAASQRGKQAQVESKKLAAREPSPPQRPVVPAMTQAAGNTVLKPIARVEPAARPSPAPEPLRLINTPEKIGRISILQLSEKTCKWPIGDPGHDDFCFCGHKPRDSAPYCEYHARIAYQPVQDRNRRRA